MRRIVTGLAALGLALTASAHQTQAQETRLLLTSLSPAGSPNSQFFNNWAKRVSDASKGLLNVEVRDGSTLANFGNSYDRTVNDVVQVGWVQLPFVAGKFPLSEVTNLPFVSDGDKYCSTTLWRLYKSGVVDAEYADVVPLWFGCLAQSGLHFNKPVASQTNLSGLKIRVNGKLPSQVVQSVGGTPISMPAENMYESLQRGTLDGVVTSWSAFEPYKLSEVSTYHIEVPVGATPSMFMMSKRKFDSLPEAARKVLMEHSGEAQSRAFGEHIQAQSARARAPVAGSDKHKIVTLSATEAKEWQTKTDMIQAEWIKERAGGDKVVSTFNQLYGQVSSGK